MFNNKRVLYHCRTPVLRNFIVVSIKMKRFLYLFFACTPAMCYSQLTNGGMENYTFGSDTVPAGWSVSSSFGTLRGRTTDAHDGNYAFVINSWYSYNPGWLVNGQLASNQFLSNSFKAGTPILGKPVLLNGFYKFTETMTTDSAFVQVILKRRNPINGNVDTVSYGTAKLPPASAYTGFQLSIHDYSPGVQPDSAVVFFATHRIGQPWVPVSPNWRYLYIDDLSFSYPTGLSENEKAQINVRFFMNELSISNPAHKNAVCYLYSLDGKLLRQNALREGETIISLAQLPNGIYLLKIDGEVQQEYKLLKE
jgi:hypothetical protein